MMKQTTPVSSPMDTLKALVLRNIEHLEYVADQLGGSCLDIPEDVFEFIDAIRQNQYAALNEHMPVDEDPRLGELRFLPDEAYRYDDGSPVWEYFTAWCGTSSHYPRYDVPRDEALARHQEWAAAYRAEVDAELRDGFDNIVRGIDWGHGDPPAAR